MEPGDDNNLLEKTDDEKCVLNPHIDEELKAILTNPDSPNKNNFIDEEVFQIETSESEYDRSICDAITAYDEHIFHNKNKSVGDTKDLLEELKESPQIDAEECESGRKESNNELNSPTFIDEVAINIIQEISPNNPTKMCNKESGSVQPTLDREEDMDLVECVAPVTDCISQSDELKESPQIDAKKSGSDRKNSNSDLTIPVPKDEVTKDVIQEISPEIPTEMRNMDSEIAGSVQPNLDKEENMDFEEPIDPVIDFTSVTSQSDKLKESPQINAKESGSDKKNSYNDLTIPVPKDEVTKDVIQEISPKNPTEMNNMESEIAGSVQPNLDKEEDMDFIEPIDPVIDCTLVTSQSDELKESHQIDAKESGSIRKNSNSDLTIPVPKDGVTKDVIQEIISENPTEIINMESESAESVQPNLDKEEDMNFEKPIDPEIDGNSQSDGFKESSRNEEKHRGSFKSKSKNVLNSPAFKGEVTKNLDIALRKSSRISRISNRGSDSAQPSIATEEDMQGSEEPIVTDCTSLRDELKEGPRIDEKGRGSRKKTSKSNLSSPASKDKSINSVTPARRSSRISNLESSRAQPSNAGEENKKDFQRTTAPVAHGNSSSDVLSCKICSTVTVSREDLRKHMVKCRRQKH